MAWAADAGDSALDGDDKTMLEKAGAHRDRSAVADESDVEPDLAETAAAWLALAHRGTNKATQHEPVPPDEFGFAVLRELLDEAYTPDADKALLIDGGTEHTRDALAHPLWRGALLRLAGHHNGMRAVLQKHAQSWDALRSEHSLVAGHTDDQPGGPFVTVILALDALLQRRVGPSAAGLAELCMLSHAGELPRALAAGVAATLAAGVAGTDGAGEGNEPADGSCDKLLAHPQFRPRLELAERVLTCADTHRLLPVPRELEPPLPATGDEAADAHAAAALEGAHRIRIGLQTLRAAAGAWAAASGARAAVKALPDLLQEEALQLAACLPPAVASATGDTAAAGQQQSQLAAARRTAQEREGAERYRATLALKDRSLSSRGMYLGSHPSAGESGGKAGAGPEGMVSGRNGRVAGSGVGGLQVELGDAYAAQLLGVDRQARGKSGIKSAVEVAVELGVLDADAGGAADGGDGAMGCSRWEPAEGEEGVWLPAVIPSSSVLLASGLEVGMLASAEAGGCRAAAAAALDGVGAPGGAGGDGGGLLETVAKGPEALLVGDSVIDELDASSSVSLAVPSGSAEAHLKLLLMSLAQLAADLAPFMFLNTQHLVPSEETVAEVAFSDADLPGDLTWAWIQEQLRTADVVGCLLKIFFAASPTQFKLPDPAAIRGGLLSIKYASLRDLCRPVTEEGSVDEAAEPSEALSGLAEMMQCEPIDLEGAILGCSDEVANQGSEAVAAASGVLLLALATASVDRSPDADGSVGNHLNSLLSALNVVRSIDSIRLMSMPASLWRLQKAVRLAPIAAQGVVLWCRASLALRALPSHALGVPAALNLLKTSAMAASAWPVACAPGALDVIMSSCELHPPVDPDRRHHSDSAVDLHEAAMNCAVRLICAGYLQPTLRALTFLLQRGRARLVDVAADRLFCAVQKIELRSISERLVDFAAVVAAQASQMRLSEPARTFAASLVQPSLDPVSAWLARSPDKMVGPAMERRLLALSSAAVAIARAFLPQELARAEANRARALQQLARLREASVQQELARLHPAEQQQQQQQHVAATGAEEQ